MIGVATGIARNNATGERRVYLEAEGRVQYLTPLEARDLANMLSTFKSYELGVLAGDLRELAARVEART